MAKRRDIGNEETEELLKRLEKRVTDEYSQAAAEVDAKFKDYMRRFEIKDKIKREAVEAGVLDKKDYIAWRQSQVMVGERWQAMVNDLAQDLHHTNEIALSTAQPYREDAYAINHNWATYEIESQSQINTSYTLYDRQTVERLMRDDPNLLPPPKPGGKTARKLAENKDLIWNRQKVTSAISQGILQGESVPQMTKRLESVAAMDHRAAIRNVRTMVTGAQNAGRVDAAKRARDMGIGLTNVWMATLDMRTRHEHRVLDGQRREIDEPFEVEGEKIKYPGDLTAPAHLVYNCRCTLVQQVKGFEYDIRGDKDVDYTGIEGMTYDEWKEDRREKPNPITLPEEKAEAIKQSYNAEYRKLRKNTEEKLAKSENGGIIENRKLAAVGNGTHWPPKTNPITKETFKELRDFAETKNIKLFGAKNADVDVGLIKDTFTAAEKVLKVFPELYNANGFPFSVQLVSYMDDEDYAQTSPLLPNTILLNVNAFRNRVLLHEDYLDRIKHKFFVDGTNETAIIQHEIGHLYQEYHSISDDQIKHIAMELLEVNNDDDLKDKLMAELSEYSTKGKIGEEILSEVFSGYFGSETPNKFVKSFMERIISMRG